MSFEVARFGDLFNEPQRNGLTRPKKVRGTGLPMVNMGELFAYPRIRSIAMDLVPVDEKEHHYLLEAGDLLFARQSLVLSGAGQCSIFLGNDAPTVFESHLIRCRLNAIRSNPLFYFYFFRSPDGRRAIEAIVEQGAGASGIRGSDLVNVQVPNPPKQIQDEIAALLGSFDDRITLLRETNTTLETIAQALFKSWFVEFDPVHAKMQGRTPDGMDEATATLFPDSFEESELGPVPNGWRVGTLADLATFQNGYAFKSKDWSEAGHPVIKIGNVKPSLISFDGCSYVGAESVIGLERFKLNRGDLLVGMTGYVGDTGLVTDVSPAAYLNQRVGRITTSLGVKNLGLVFCLSRNEDFKTFAEGQSHGSAQANVSGVDLLKFKFVIPSDKLIDVFNQTMETLIESIMSNHEQAQNLSSLRDALLPRLISGQLQIGEAEKVTA